MSEQCLTMAEIEKTYPREWVLVDRLVNGPDEFALAGVVVRHSADRDEVYRAAEELPPPRHVAIFYTGPLPEDAIFLL